LSAQPNINGDIRIEIPGALTIFGPTKFVVLLEFGKGAAVERVQKINYIDGL
jgi:hypothetical protein